MNYKKKNLIIIAFILIVLSLLLFSGCESIVSLETVEVVCSTENSTYEIGAFRYDDYQISARYSDGTVKTIPLTEEMVSEYDKIQLLQVGTHSISVGYENKKVTFTVTVVGKKVVTSEGDDTVAPYLADLCVTYDGKPHTLSVEGDVPQGATILYPNGNSFTDAGAYPVTATIQADGYDTVTLSATLTIQKAVYCFDGFSVIADYGTDNEGNPRTSFVYDGLSHGISFVGTYPAELGEPTVKIVNLADKTATYENGGTAVNAGHYKTTVTFEGDSKNYLVDNLSYTCNFEISKKPISVEVLNAIKFEDLTIPYDAKPHRIDIGKVELPEGISVDYYEADGKTQFVSKTEVGEYDVICKFQTDNPNLEIINALSAHLSILQVNYINVNKLHIGFEDESTSITYDGTAHELIVFGLNKNVTVKKFIWHKSETEDVEITSLTDVLVDSLGKTTSYSVTAVFNLPSDGNHKPVDDIHATLTVEKATFENPTYLFESVTETYSEGETYEMTYTEQSMPVGMTSQLHYTAPGIVEEIDGLPSITCLPYDSQKPKQNCGVGIYTCTLTFHYNPNNYVDAPQSIEPVIRTLEIQNRVYHADEIIGVDNVRTVYAAGKNLLPLCTFDEALPSWVSQNYLTIAVKRGTSTLLYETSDAGEYDYFFRFSYFNGTKIVTADSSSAELKIVGKQIYDKYYSVTHGATFTYDGTTDCLPSATLSSEVENILSIYCTYSFAEIGSDTFTLVYSGDGKKASMMADSTCLESSKLAGNHKFEFVISGNNFEPLTVSFTSTVDQKKYELPGIVWKVKKDVLSASYDGKSHADLYSFVSEPSVEQKALVQAVPQFVSCDRTVANVGVDVGVYTYKLTFVSKDSNYYLDVTESDDFKYSFEITSRDVFDTEETNYSPVGFFYTDVFSGERYHQTIGTKTTVTYTSDSLVFPYAKLYGTKISDTQYSLSVSDLGTPWFSKEACEIYHWTTDTQTANEETNRIRALINQAFTDDLTIYVVGPTGTQEINGLNANGCTDVSAVTKEMCGLISANETGTYTILLILPNDNILYDGSRILAYTFRPKALETQLQDPVKLGTDSIGLIKREDGVFNGLSFVPSTANGSTLSEFAGARMVVYDTIADGNAVKATLFSSSYSIITSQIGNASSYIVCCDKQGNVLQNQSTWQAVYPFSPLGDLVTRGELSQNAYTEAGIYYLFINLGPNVMLKDTEEHSFVIRINVLFTDLTASDVATLKASNGTTYTQGTSRLYGTDASNVTYRYGTSAIAGVDAVVNTSAYTGKKVYTFNALYNGKKMGLSVLNNLSEYVQNTMSFSVTYVGYAFKNGGATLGTSYGYYSNTGLSYKNLQDLVAELYSSATAKNNGVTSVGLYYLFVTIESEGVLCEGERSFVITVQVDRDNASGSSTYVWESQQYDILSSLPLKKQSFTWDCSKTEWNYNATDAYIESIKSQTGLEQITIGNYTYSTISSSIIGTHDLHVTLVFNADRYGEYATEGDYPILEITKKTINLSDLASIGNQTYTQSSVNGQTITNDLTSKITAELKKLGIYPSHASRMVSCIFTTSAQPFVNTQSGTAYTKISLYGTYRLKFVFYFGKNETFYNFYDIVAGSHFSQSGNTYTADSTYQITITVSQPS